MCATIAITGFLKCIKKMLKHKAACILNGIYIDEGSVQHMHVMISIKVNDSSTTLQQVFGIN